MPDPFVVRAATFDDVPAIAALIDASVRGLAPGYYTPAQIDGGLREVFGVDTQLIADGTYYVIESDGALAAAGGWSARRTLFGGDQMKGAEDPLLDPAREAARIRAFFVHPAWARRGLGRRLYATCAHAAAAAGFTSFALMGTLPGVPLYEALGFVKHEDVLVPLADGGVLPGIRMTRDI